MLLLQITYYAKIKKTERFTLQIYESQILFPTYNMTGRQKMLANYKTAEGEDFTKKLDFLYHFRKSRFDP